MNTILSILILLSLTSVVIVLFIGIISMIKGGKFNEKYGNKLMRLRVALQGLTILLLALAYFLAQN
ncbi:MAG: twin transmembrane helix small protein [Alphaproteobacteria bacterium]